MSDEDEGGPQGEAPVASRKMTLVGVAPPPPVRPLSPSSIPPRRLPPDTLEDISPPGARRRVSSIPAGAFGDDPSTADRDAPSSAPTSTTSSEVPVSSALEQARGMRRRRERDDPRPWGGSSGPRPSGTWPRGSGPPASGPPIKRQVSAPRDLGAILEDLESLPPPKTQTGIKRPDLDVLRGIRPAPSGFDPPAGRPPVSTEPPRAAGAPAAVPLERARPPSPSSEPPTDRMPRLPEGVLEARAHLERSSEADTDPPAPVPVVRAATPRPPAQGLPSSAPSEEPEAPFPRPVPTPLPPRRLSGPEYEAVHAKTEIIRRPSRPPPRERRWLLPITVGAVGAAAVAGALIGVSGSRNTSSPPGVADPSAPERAEVVALPRPFRPVTVRPPAMPSEVRAMEVNARRRAASERREGARRLHSARDFEGARAKWVEALTFLPDDDRAAEGLALTLAETGEGRLALGWASRAVELAPSDSQHREVYGRLLERAGYRQLALAEYEAGLQVAPQNLRLRQRVSALRTPHEH